MRRVVEMLWVVEIQKVAERHRVVKKYDGGGLQRVAERHRVVK